MTLTPAQKKCLTALAVAPVFERGGVGPEGMNLTALNKLRAAGLVERIANPTYAPIVTRCGHSRHASEWRITDAGRTAVKAT